MNRERAALILPVAVLLSIEKSNHREQSQSARPGAAQEKQRPGTLARGVKLIVRLVDLVPHSNAVNCLERAITLNTALRPCPGDWCLGFEYALNGFRRAERFDGGPNTYRNRPFQSA
jgi:hypothetical protein